MKFIRLAVVALAVVALAVVALAGLLAATASAEEIRVQSTTDIHDSGQWENVIEKLYLKANPGDTLKAEFVGTGKALENAEAGKADVVITHAPSLEKKFVENGYSQEALGRAIFYNDYVIVGPTTDPAAVATKDPKNAIGAYETIGKAGAANSHIRFDSRNDASGTNVQEQILWGKTEGVPKREACNAKSPSEGRFEPGTGACGGGVPAWYIQTGLGQGANLEATSKCTKEMEEATPKGGCYTMLDRGTWLNNKAKFTNLKIVSEGNTEGKGGASLQTNYFHAYVLSTAKAPYPNGTTPNIVAGQRFVNFLVSESTQKALAEYPTKKEPAGHPDAVGEATYVSSPTHGPAESEVTVTATLTYAAPPNLLLQGYPEVQLQRFNGTWGNVAGKVGETNAEGKVTFTGVKLLASTTKFRVSLVQHADSTEGIFTLFTAGIPRGEPLSVPVP
jgi:tungstate transport system substrate-binding protein